MEELNVDNPLGTKGELAKRFCNIIRRLWNGDKESIAPTTLKKTIEQF
jgi:ubiquitin carboxyl-terminal hydrolase 4/11/15